MKKLFNVVLILVVCFFGIKNVSAETVKKQAIAYKVVIKYNNEEISYPVSINTINGKAVYSFDNLNDISGDYDEIDNIDIDSKKLEEILAIAYYGFKYNNRGSTVHYMATQKMIWETYLGDDCQVSFYDTYNNIVNLTNEIDYIQNYLNKYDLLPDFEDKLEHILYGDYSYIQDTNNLLSDYEVKGSDKVFINENYLQINTSELGSIDFTLQRKENYIKKYKLFKNANQFLISPGIIKEFKKDYQANIEYGKIKIILKDENESLIDDALFSIYNLDNEKIDTQKTENGVLFFDNLKSDSYIIKQESTNNSCNIFEDEINILLNDKTFIEQVVYNDIKIGNMKMKINNKDEDLEFELNLYDNNDNYIDTYNTFKGVIFLTLKYGNYYLKEKDDRFTINFDIKDDGVLIYNYEDEIDEEEINNDKQEEIINISKPTIEYEDSECEKQKEDENIDDEILINENLKIPNKDLDETIIKVPITEKNSYWGISLIYWIGLGAIYVKKFI